MVYVFIHLHIFSYEYTLDAELDSELLGVLPVSLLFAYNYIHSPSDMLKAQNQALDWPISIIEQRYDPYSLLKRLTKDQESGSKDGKSTRLVTESI